MAENETGITGCTWVVGRSKKYNFKTKAHYFASIHCNKIPATGDCYCPKHRLFAAELGDQQKGPQEARQRAY